MSPFRLVKCKLGFDCASMMQTPGLNPNDCLNKENCGLLSVDESGQELSLFTPSGSSLFSRTSAALAMLNSRGCPQTLQSLGIAENMTNIYANYVYLNDALDEFAFPNPGYSQTYISPPEIEAHRYNVKRPSGVYWYNKLTANTAIFHPANRPNNVRVIHLSKDNDPRNIIAREGIEKRNKLLQINTKLQQANQLLQEALELLS